MAAVAVYLQNYILFSYGDRLRNLFIKLLCIHSHVRFLHKILTMESAHKMGQASASDLIQRLAKCMKRISSKRLIDG